MLDLYSPEEKEFILERRELSLSRIREIENENAVPAPYMDFFKRGAEFIIEPSYEAALPEKYGSSWFNPVYAVRQCGKEMGRMLSFLAYELLGIIAFRAEGRLLDETILEEVFLEVYSAFTASYTENNEKPSNEEIHGILYSFVSDYADHTVAFRTREMLDTSLDFAKDIIMNSDLSDVSYLDKFGEYIDDDTRRVAAFLNSLDEADIKAMADTYTEGFRIGFINTGKDLSKKKSVSIHYVLGFERVVRESIKNFRALGLEPTIYRRQLHAASRNGMRRNGFQGAWVNKQMDYDHREDNALFLDKAFVTRKLEVMKSTFEKFKKEAREYAGPAVMEVFGEKPFTPETHEESYSLSEEQHKLAVELAAKSGTITSQYIRGDERSFTIISYPVPAIGKDFEEIFRETVKLNTLDYEKYKIMQQHIIDVLEMGDHVEIKGRGANRTDITVQLHELPDKKTQTVFENCVADVNIPVGEVFTSPKLSGTNGKLFVSEVYLFGLRYENLEFTFKDGFVTDYSCTNFESEEENRKYIESGILHHHKTLTLGEFAIGTNTTAYAMAKRYNIFSRLEILIAEKTGPHFALGDTCYSREEDVVVHNPDGREIIAKDNEHTLKRKSDTNFTYFECHTDVTIPYDELDTITAVDSDGNRYPIIAGGRFVVKGTEELNKPLDEF